MSIEAPLKGHRIAVFGASSKIAIPFIERAVGQGAQVLAFVRSDSKLQSLPENVERVIGDITNPDDVLKALKGKRIDTTVNFAAVFNMSAKSQLAHQVNVLGEENVLTASQVARVRRHIFISTTGVHIPGENAYKDTKLAGEELVKASKIPEWVILRYANVLGTTDPNDLWNNPFQIKYVFGKRVGFTVSGPTQTPFPYLSVDTAVDSTIRALMAKPNQTITIVDGFTTLGEYLEIAALRNNLDKIVGIPYSLLVAGIKLLGPSSPFSPGTIEVLFNPHNFDNREMIEKLGVKPRKLDEFFR